MKCSSHAGQIPHRLRRGWRGGLRLWPRGEGLPQCGLRGHRHAQRLRHAELNRRLEQQAAELKARDGKIASLEKANQEMQRELTAQKEFASRLKDEFATMQKAVARLTDKSANTFALNHSPAEGQ